MQPQVNHLVNLCTVTSSHKMGGLTVSTDAFKGVCLAGGALVMAVFVAGIAKAVFHMYFKRYTRIQKIRARRRRKEVGSLFTAVLNLFMVPRLRELALLPRQTDRGIGFSDLMSSLFLQFSP